VVFLGVCGIVEILRWSW